jgi:L-ascorbate metabolism protein UlaG (beta-lactamase superfamily)
VRLTWYGHSTVLVELDGVRLLTDPVLRSRVLHLRRSARMDAQAIGQLDGILVSHGHWDHLDLPSLRRVASGATVIAPRGLGPLLRRRGCASVTELSRGEGVDLGALRIRAVHAEHRMARRGFGRTSAALGYVLSGSRRVYFAGDTDLFAGMSDLAPLDVALLPVSGWGRRLPAGHLDPKRAADALARLRPTVAVPIHWGTYSAWRARPTDPWPAEEFARAAADAAPGVAVRILAPGVTIDL